MEWNQNQVKKIGIFRALQLGDLLCAIPACRNLRMNFPKAKIYFIGLPGSKALIDRFPYYFDEFIAFPGYPGLPEQEFDPAAFNVFRQHMQNLTFDLLLQMQGNGTVVNKMLKQFGPQVLAGFSLNESEISSNPFMMHYPNSGHESFRHLKLISHIGLKVVDTAMEYPLFKQDEANFAQKGFPLASRYICIHAGSRAVWRQWPTGHFARLGDLCVQNGYQIVLTGTQAEATLAQEVVEQMHHPALVLAGQTDLGTLGVLLKKSSGLIANCTGISHIAAGLKIPSIIISMDGEPERWAPIDHSIHDTVDWTKQPDFKRVKQGLLRFLIPGALLPAVS